MEEQKGKVVEMQPTTKEVERPEKMSYEQLENVAHQLSEQSRQLYIKLQQANMNNMFKRLDYLFKVIANADQFSKVFIAKCVKEVEEIMTIPEQDNQEQPDKAKPKKD